MYILLIGSAHTRASWLTPYGTKYQLPTTSVPHALLHPIFSVTHPIALEAGGRQPISETSAWAQRDVGTDSESIAAASGALPTRRVRFPTTRDEDAYGMSLLRRIRGPQSEKSRLTTNHRMRRAHHHCRGCHAHTRLGHPSLQIFR